MNHSLFVITLDVRCGRLRGGTVDRSEPPMAASAARRDDAGMASEEVPVGGNASASGGYAGKYRIEHDSMGEVRVPADALWGAQTQRAVENFPISDRALPAAVIHALGLIKAEAARVNKVDARVAAAADEVAAGSQDAQFPIDSFQTGSGTSSNMNANEVIAHLAGEGVHPNDDVNMSQSSNDVFPSAVPLAAAIEICQELVPA